MPRLSRPQRPTPLPRLPLGQVLAMEYYAAGRLPLLATAAALGVSRSMLSRELMGVRLMPEERVQALLALFL